jgi:hypothetical protein
MKTLSLLAGLVLLCLATNTFAQSRAVGGRQVVIDNGDGGKLTIVYTGVGDDTLEIGNGGFGGLPAGTSGQTLRNNGTTFDTTSTLLNTGTQIHTRGGVVHALRNVSASAELTETDHIVLVHWTECGQIDITLPEPSVGRVIVIRRIEECGDCGECQGTVTVIPNADESIDGWTDYTLWPWAPAVQLVSDGTNWYSIGSTFGGF